MSPTFSRSIVKQTSEIQKNTFYRIQLSSTSTKTTPPFKMSFKPILPALPTRPRSKGSNSIAGLLDALHENMSMTTILLIGATIQALLVVLPIRPVYSLTPAVALLLIRLIDTLLITYELRPNPYLKNAIPKKSTPVLPDRNGNFDAPGSEKIAVLILGAKSNHPLGIFAPDFKIVGDYFQTMIEELEGDLTQETGFLGQTGLTRRDDNGANEFIMISYWRSLEDVHNYAHTPAHREAWKWWDRTIKSHNHIGFMHEVYEADKGMWEGIFINFQPTLLGKTTFLKKEGKLVGGEVKEEWISPLLDANKGPLRTSNMRRGVSEKKEVLEEMFAKNVYEI